MQKMQNLGKQKNLAKILTRRNYEKTKFVYFADTRGAKKNNYTPTVWTNFHIVGFRCGWPNWGVLSWKFGALWSVIYQMKKEH
jgi:hypothetical protein